MSNYKKLIVKQGTGIKAGREYRKEFINPELSDSIPDALNLIEQQIEKLKNNVWESAWYLGKRFAVIRDKYLQETGFNNIYEYAESKYNFNYRTVYRFIFLSEKFTLVTVLSMGSKLYLLQGLDEKKFANYLQWIETENPSYNAIINKLKADKPGRPKQDININRYRLTVNFRKLGFKLDKKQQKSFLDELKTLIERYKDMT